MKKLVVVLVLAAILVGIYFYVDSKEKEAVFPQASSQENTETTGATTSETESNSLRTSSADEDAPSAAAKAPSTPLTAEEKSFEDTIQHTLASLPTLKDLRNLSAAETHHTPKLLMQAGSEIGRISELLEANPKLAPRAIPFYEKCASGENYPPAIRALCFSHLKRLDASASARAHVPSEIRELADDL